ncbi:MAG TPA: hypothetical protein VFP68_10030 [Burkholderiaceae bacterium]|nr:hypothetical protein [Burkholderiaceae bacterium]
MKSPQIITATRSELDEILTLTKPLLPQRQYELLEGVLGAYEFVMLKLQDAKTSVGRLQRMLFGSSTECKRNVIKDVTEPKVMQPDTAEEGARSIGAADAIDATDAGPVNAPDAAKPTPAPKKKRKGHGRNAAQAYRGAPVVECVHPDIQAGQRCPECGTGRVYASPPKVVVKVVGQAPLAATVYRLQRLRCRLCDALFTAPAPAAAASAGKCDASSASMIAVLRYGYGMPLHRLQQLQAQSARTAARRHPVGHHRTSGASAALCLAISANVTGHFGQRDR